MLAILPLILLIVRLSHFNRLARAIQTPEIYRARRLSIVALAVFSVFTLFSFIVPSQIPGVDPMWSSGAVLIVGVLIAAAFDIKADRIKRRAGVSKTEEAALEKKGEELQQQDELPRQLYSQGSKAEVRGKIAEAEAKYRAVIEQFPETIYAKDAQISLNMIAKNRNG